MIFRRFTPEDADFCFRVRSSAFIIKFYGELSPKEVAAGVNFFMPSDYIKMAEEHPLFLCEENGQRLGFFTLKRHDNTTAELPLLYLNLHHLHKGVGGTALRYAVEWIQTNWKGVTNLFIDTVIPKYNSGFYQKAGFTANGESFCDFNGHKVKALRFTKEIEKN